MKLIVANLKMNKTKEEMIEYKKVLEENISSNNLIICPQSIYLDYMISSNYVVGAQDVYIEDSGSFTGEISPDALESIGVKYSIIGHSERRENFNETNELINKKIEAAISNNIMPILCVGETKEEKDQNKTEEVLRIQVKECLKNINSPVIIAYEPVWAISTNGPGIIPTNEEIQNTIQLIKSIRNEKVLYGGSVNLKNIDTLLQISNVDGFLIGSASLDPSNMIEIIKKGKSYEQ